jgi:U3 small nucleolar RNA-associated protein 3
MLDDPKWGSQQKRPDSTSDSDEEILPLEGLSEEDEDEEDTEISDEQDDNRSMNEEEQEQEDLNDEAWGSSRKVYYGANDVSDEEDVAQEEQEADCLSAISDPTATSFRLFASLT